MASDPHAPDATEPRGSGDERSEADRRFDRQVRTAPEQVAAAITEAILSGSLPPGSRLPSEVELAERFGVSRPTVRQALRSLKAASILRSERGRTGGHWVEERQVTRRSVGASDFMTLAIGSEGVTYADISEVRSELELVSAALAAQRRTDDDLDVLFELIDGIVDIDDLDDALERDLHFHHRLAVCTHNPLLIAFADSTIIAFQDTDLDGTVLTPTEVLAHLPTIALAVRRRDGDGARAAMRRHLDATRGRRNG